jgi:hypothetical protein
MKALLGQPNLAWKTDAKEGAYAGQPVWDYAKCADPPPANTQSTTVRNQGQSQEEKDRRIGAGCYQACYQAVQTVQSRGLTQSTRPW